MTNVRFEVEVGVVRALESRGLFQFTAEAAATVEEVVVLTQRSSPGVDPEYFTRLREHIYLAAAEYALAPAFVAGPKKAEQPVPVTDPYIRLGALKYNCNLILGCWSPQRQMGPEDMTVFSADVSRIATLLGDFSRLAEGPSVLHDLASKLEAAYSDHPSPTVSAVGKTQAVRLQGVLWRLQLTVGDYPGYPGPLEAALDDSRNALDLT
jgi:hypothetical protein